MKKIVSLILLVLIFVAGNSYELWFTYMRQHIRHEIKREIRNGLQNSELCLIVLTADNEKDIHWIKNGKEFRYKGAMYDVVNQERKNGKIYFYCINDVKENKLVENYLLHTKKKGVTVLLKRMFANKFFLVQSSLSLNNKFSKIKHSEKQFFISSRFIDKISPPPKA